MYNNFLPINLSLTRCILFNSMPTSPTKDKFYVQNFDNVNKIHMCTVLHVIQGMVFSYYSITDKI